MLQRLAAVAAFLVLVPTVGLAQEAAYAKAGVSRAELDVQGVKCVEEARGVRPRNPAYTPPYTPNAYAAAGTAFAVGVMQGIAEGKARNAYIDACMRDQGYGRVTLTPDEQASLKAAKSPAARDAWFDAFLAKDLTSRVQVALTPKVPPIAAAVAEPYAIGGLRIDPATIAVAPGAVEAKQSLLTAQAGHRRTAVLKQDFRVSGPLDIRAEAGAVFHQVSYASGPRGAFSGDTQWCGPVRNNSVRGRISMPNCIWATFDGYQAAAPAGARLWLQGDGAPAGPPATIRDATLALEESDQDLIGPMELKLRLARLTKAGAMLEAIASRDGETVEVWSGFVTLDGGQGALPFWGKRLRLTRVGDLVTATLEEGDGRGWLDLAPESTGR